jgi:hypothetical protein
MKLNAEIMKRAGLIFPQQENSPMILISQEKFSRLIRKIAPYIPLLLFVTIAIVITGISFQAFRQIETLILRDELHNLGAIADLKVKQISAWKKRYLEKGDFYRPMPMNATAGDATGCGKGRQRMHAGNGFRRYSMTFNT